jgi:hypothetical protein
MKMMSFNKFTHRKRMIAKNCLFLVKENTFILTGGNEIREVDCHSIYGSPKSLKDIEIVLVLEGLDLLRNKNE